MMADTQTQEAQEDVSLHRDQVPMTVVDRTEEETPKPGLVLPEAPEPVKRLRFWEVDLLAWAKSDVQLMFLAKWLVILCVCVTPMSLWAHSEYIGVHKQLIDNHTYFLGRPAFPSRPEKADVTEVVEVAETIE